MDVAGPHPRVAEEAGFLTNLFCSQQKTHRRLTHVNMSTDYLPMIRNVRLILDFFPQHEGFASFPDLSHRNDRHIMFHRLFIKGLCDSAG